MQIQNAYLKMYLFCMDVTHFAHLPSECNNCGCSAAIFTCTVTVAPNLGRKHRGSSRIRVNHTSIHWTCLLMVCSPLQLSWPRAPSLLPFIFSEGTAGQLMSTLSGPVRYIFRQAVQYSTSYLLAFYPSPLSYSYHYTIQGGGVLSWSGSSPSETEPPH